MDTLLPEVDAAAQSAAARDKEWLQGAWYFVSGIREAELLVAGDHFTVKFKNGDIYLGTFTLDTAARPKAIDMLIQEGPSRHKGKVSYGIYDLDGEHLVFCPGEPGSDERPSAFPHEDDWHRLCLVFRHERHRRPTPLYP
jgi:uncharacterized protein (TIGR03067 family)